MSNIRQQSVEGIKPGASWTITRTFSEADTMAFGDMSRDYNPVHYDDRFALAKGFKGRICHGLLTASMISEIGGQLGWLAASMQFDFKKPVYFGDTITNRLTVHDITENGFATATATFHNQDGLCVIQAKLTGILPGYEEQEIMKSMIQEGDPTNKLRD